MKRVRHSRSGLFLIELMICILFFSITAGICIQFFVKSHNMSQDAKNLYQAQQEATQAQNQAQEDDLKKVKIAVYSGENSKGESSKKEEIYHLNLSIYIP